jgi:hypothetical protein
MKPTQISIVLFGRDAHLLETRKWVLQSLGYRVLAVGRVSELRNIPSTPPVALLVLCHTLSARECAVGAARASKRWPQVKKLALVRRGSQTPAGMLDQVLETLDGPTRLLATIGELVGYAGSSSYSHTY